MPLHPISLVSEWFVAPGCEDEACRAVLRLAQHVEREEPDTLTYLVHRASTDASLQALPPVRPGSITFFETYRDADAFRAHVSGPTFTRFVADHGALFVQVGSAPAEPKPYVTVRFLDRLAGFTRGDADASLPTADDLPPNRHPAAMFEILANDQAAMMEFYAQVFDWTYASGSDGFAFVLFPPGPVPQVGGIGQANAAISGFAPGRNFYLLVDRCEPVLAAAFAAGGQPLMAPTDADGYRFAMFLDPEGNPIGIIERFGNGGGDRSTGDTALPSPD